MHFDVFFHKYPLSQRPRHDTLTDTLTDTDAPSTSVLKTLRLRGATLQGAGWAFIGALFRALTKNLKNVVWTWSKYASQTVTKQTGTQQHDWLLVERTQLKLL